MPFVHELKIWPQEYALVLGKAKKAEFRRNDRDFGPLDFLHLHEFDPNLGYTGRSLMAQVTYICHGPQFGIPPGYCIMSLDVLADRDFRNEHIQVD